MSGVMGQSLQLADYLEKLPGTTFKKLYLQPSTAFAIFRCMLPPLGKTIVCWLLYMPKPYQLDELDARIAVGAKRQKDQALTTLRGLHIIQFSHPSQGRGQEIHLTPNFKTSIQLALEGGGEHKSFGVPSSLPIPPEVTIDFLDRHARNKWDAILHYIVNCAVPGVVDSGGPKASVKDLLLAGNLIRREGGRTVITQTGFTFLLQRQNAQVWTLLLLWLERAPDASLGLQNTDMLSFLFLLASLELGKAYDTNSLPEERQNMLPTLMDFGLVYIPSHKPQQYFPTRLATDLTNTARTHVNRSLSDGFDEASRASGESKGSIILETNFRIYAYTNSPLQIAVLTLFSRPSVRFPDMVSGRLTRESIRRAITFGITADQIISYLAAHAHEQMHRFSASEGKPVLAPTVVDQIRLWQLETERMKATSGFLFRDFDDEKEYIDISGFADEIGVLVWKNDRRRMFFASKHEAIRDFLKMRKRV
ncbi:RNA polymerase II transcription factor B subunit 2 [Plectosphaerella plurivora]|uniref:RNA polymerase II transcription factor B subunit 2 n=1 Tax=Plectosphaerella plurivora TaxID=936078 RepID=A0A9P8VHA7_9PEZI|nr:RNA polymerase II transcription factor B subunit 2 [Plectosphaerella plurivora]